MPADQPFTRLCQAIAGLAPPSRADLHLHTTASDGRYSPEQVVDLARRTGLAAIAVTDHDTLGGYERARVAAASALTVIPAVEISAECDGHEFHLLGFFVRPDDAALNEALDRLRSHRAGRFHDMLWRLKRCGLSLPEEAVSTNGTALGRRHLANLLVEAGRVGTIREAFSRYLSEDRPAFVPKLRLDVAEAIHLVREAGGVAGYAHPPAYVDLEALVRLRGLGLQAVEAVYPSFTVSRSMQLQRMAETLDLAVTGGSDCHGPDEPRRAVGCRTISRTQLAILRAKVRMTNDPPMTHQ